jgi:hypothetical protein
MWHILFDNLHLKFVALYCDIYDLWHVKKYVTFYIQHPTWMNKWTNEWMNEGLNIPQLLPSSMWLLELVFLLLCNVMSRNFLPQHAPVALFLFPQKLEVHLKIWATSFNLNSSHFLFQNRQHLYCDYLATASVNHCCTLKMI